MQNNNYFEELKKSMSQETLEKYKKIGQDFFSNFDFESGYMRRLQSRENEIVDILSALRSGLRAEDLDPEEIELLKKKFGEKWEQNIDLGGKEIPQ